MTGVSQRRSERSQTTQRVGLRHSRGFLSDVWLVDLSVTGCQVVISTGTLEVAQRIVVRPEGIAALSAIVRWIDEKHAGIEFEQGLHPSVLQHLIRSNLYVPEVPGNSTYPVYADPTRSPPPVALRLFRSVALNSLRPAVTFVAVLQCGLSPSTKKVRDVALARRGHEPALMPVWPSRRMSPSNSLARSEGDWIWRTIGSQMCASTLPAPTKRRRGHYEVPRLRTH